MSEAMCSALRLQEETSQGSEIACADGSPPRVLLAEDSMAARVLTAALLRRMGCHVDAVEHGEDAVCRVRDTDYDVVLMDIEMPVMDGLTAAQEIRAIEGEAADTPIVALSAFIADSQKSHTWRESFDISLPKPAGRDQLREVIETVLNRTDEERIDTPDKAIVHEDHARLLNEDALADLKSQMAGEQLAELLKTACDELIGAARDLRACMAKADRAGAAGICHRIRGIAGGFAAPCLADAAQRLETRLRGAAEDAPEGCEQSLLDSLEATVAALSAVSHA